MFNAANKSPFRTHRSKQPSGCSPFATARNARIGARTETETGEHQRKTIASKSARVPIRTTAESFAIDQTMEILSGTNFANMLGVKPSPPPPPPFNEAGDSSIAPSRLLDAGEATMQFLPVLFTQIDNDVVDTLTALEPIDGEIITKEDDAEREIVRAFFRSTQDFNTSMKALATVTGSLEKQREQLTTPLLPRDEKSVTLAISEVRRHIESILAQMNGYITTKHYKNALFENMKVTGETSDNRAANTRRSLIGIRLKLDEILGPASAEDLPYATIAQHGKVKSDDATMATKENATRMQNITEAIDKEEVTTEDERKDDLFDVLQESLLERMQATPGQFPVPELKTMVFVTGGNLPELKERLLDKRAQPLRIALMERAKKTGFIALEGGPTQKLLHAGQKLGDNSAPSQRFAQVRRPDQRDVTFVHALLVADKVDTTDETLHSMFGVLLHPVQKKNITQIGVKVGKGDGESAKDLMLKIFRSGVDQMWARLLMAREFAPSSSTLDRERFEKDAAYRNAKKLADKARKEQPILLSAHILAAVNHFMATFSTILLIDELQGDEGDEGNEGDVKTKNETRTLFWRAALLNVGNILEQMGTFDPNANPELAAFFREERHIQNWFDATLGLEQAAESLFNQLPYSIQELLVVSEDKQTLSFVPGVMSTSFGMGFGLGVGIVAFEVTPGSLAGALTGLIADLATTALSSVASYGAQTVQSAIVGTTSYANSAANRVVGTVRGMAIVADNTVRRVATYTAETAYPAAVSATRQAVTYTSETATATAGYLSYAAVAATTATAAYVYDYGGPSFLGQATNDQIWIHTRFLIGAVYLPARLLPEVLGGQATGTITMASAMILNITLLQVGFVVMDVITIGKGLWKEEEQQQNLANAVNRVTLEGYLTTLKTYAENVKNVISWANAWTLVKEAFGALRAIVAANPIGFGVNIALGLGGSYTLWTYITASAGISYWFAWIMEGLGFSAHAVIDATAWWSYVNAGTWSWMAIELSRHFAHAMTHAGVFAGRVIGTNSLLLFAAGSVHPILSLFGGTATTSVGGRLSVLVAAGMLHMWQESLLPEVPTGTWGFLAGANNLFWKGLPYFAAGVHPTALVSRLHNIGTTQRVVQTFSAGVRRLPVYVTPNAALGSLAILYGFSELLAYGLTGKPFYLARTFSNAIVRGLNKKALDAEVRYRNARIDAPVVMERLKVATEAVNNLPPNANNLERNDALANQADAEQDVERNERVTIETREAVEDLRDQIAREAARRANEKPRRGLV